MLVKGIPSFPMVTILAGELISTIFETSHKIIVYETFILPGT
jgi:hypothetical protein